MVPSSTDMSSFLRIWRRHSPRVELCRRMSGVDLVFSKAVAGSITPAIGIYVTSAWIADVLWLWTCLQWIFELIYNNSCRPEPHILLFRRPLGTDPVSGDVDPEAAREAKERYLQELAINQNA